MNHDENPVVLLFVIFLIALGVMWIINSGVLEPKSASAVDGKATTEGAAATTVAVPLSDLMGMISKIANGAVASSTSSNPASGVASPTVGSS